jgi:hypothetical protein
MRPHHLLLYLILVGALALTTSALWPEKGIRLSEGWTVQFPSLEDLFRRDTLSAVNVDSLLASYEIDSTAVKDSLRKAEIAFRQKMLRIQYQDSSPLLAHFFQQLVKREQGTGRVDVLHYGDSQIEGDRITSVVRDQLQKQFGGTGSGYIAADPLVSHFNITNNRSANWQRHPVFGTRDSLLQHNGYGMYGVFSRFTAFPSYDTLRRNPMADSLSLSDSLQYTVVKTLPNDSLVNAFVELQPSGIGYYRARSFRRLRLMFSNPDAPFELTVIQADSSRQVSNFQKSATPRLSLGKVFTTVY